MTTHPAVTLTQKERQSIVKRYPLSANLPTHLTHDHGMDNASLEEWHRELDAHLTAYKKGNTAVRGRIRELVRLNMRASRSSGK
jgi:hypothetical protein